MGLQLLKSWEEKKGQRITRFVPKYEVPEFAVISPVFKCNESQVWQERAA
jgi:hypothetical protein